MFTKSVKSWVLLLLGLLLGLALSWRPAAATPPPPTVIKIPDLDYIKRTYFLIADHPIKVKPGSLLVFGAYGPFAPAPSMAAIARLNPTAPPDSVNNPQWYGDFVPLDQGLDYEDIRPWLINDGSGLEIPVLRLATPLTPYDRLAVSYTDQSSGSDVQVGTVTPAADPSLGKPQGVALLKMIHTTIEDFPGDPATGLFDPRAPWYPTLAYEMRNLYDLLMRDIPVERMYLKVRATDAGAAVDPEAVQGVPLIQILGLDQQGDPGASDPLAPDGRVDAQYINPHTGRIFFPDFHPFAPDTTNPTGRCNTAGGFGGYNCIDNFGRNRLRDDAWDFALRSNLAVYYARTPNPFTDSRFYIEMTVLPPDEPGGVLRPNVPNPFNPGTRIQFELYQADRARVTIYDVQGRLVAQLVDAMLPRGVHGVAWNGNDARGSRVASGIYFCRLETGGQTYSNRMVLSR